MIERVHLIRLALRTRDAGESLSDLFNKIDDFLKWAHDQADQAAIVHAVAAIEELYAKQTLSWSHLRFMMESVYSFLAKLPAEPATEPVGSIGEEVASGEGLAVDPVYGTPIPESVEATPEAADPDPAPRETRATTRKRDPLAAGKTAD